jgi:hypothetical protein
MATSDPTAYFRAYVQSRAYTLGPSGTRKKRIPEAYLMAQVSAGATITQTLTRDWGLDSATDTVDLTPAASETHCRRRFEATDVSDWIALYVTLGDVGLDPALVFAWALNQYDGLAEVQDGAK